MGWENYMPFILVNMKAIAWQNILTNQMNSVKQSVNKRCKSRYRIIMQICRKLQHMQIIYETSVE